MRVENVNVKITIPLPINEPDKNGVIYTEEAIKKAVDNFTPNAPLLTDDDTDDDLETCIGVVNSIELSNDNKNMIVDANIFAAGSCEIIGERDHMVVKDFRITSFGICR